MSQAHHAKSAKARATILRNIYVNNRTGNFNRNLDNCLEMGDGTQVVAECLKRIEWDLAFCLAMLNHERCGVPELTAAIKAKYNWADLRALDESEYLSRHEIGWHRPIQERINQIVKEQTV